MWAKLWKNEISLIENFFKYPPLVLLLGLYPQDGGAAVLPGWYDAYLLPGKINRLPISRNTLFSRPLPPLSLADSDHVAWILASDWLREVASHWPHPSLCRQTISFTGRDLLGLMYSLFIRLYKRYETWKRKKDYLSTKVKGFLATFSIHILSHVCWISYFLEFEFIKPELYPILLRDILSIFSLNPLNTFWETWPEFP